MECLSMFELVPLVMRTTRIIECDRYCLDMSNFKRYCGNDLGLFASHAASVNR